MTPLALELHTNFTGLDWGIVAVYMVGTVLIGIYVNRYIANMTDYVVAGRALRSSPGVATMIGAELGLVTVMYSAQKGFTGGFAALHVGIVAGVAIGGWFDIRALFRSLAEQNKASEESASAQENDT